MFNYNLRMSLDFKKIEALSIFIAMRFQEKGNNIESKFSERSWPDDWSICKW